MKWFVPLAVLAAATLLARNASAAQGADPSYTDNPSDAAWMDQALATMEGINPMGSPVDYMRTSASMKARLQQREGLRLKRYRLGDGGWTIGYGRYYPDGSTVPPEQIDQATAEDWFATDLVDRGEKWVKSFVSIPLQQNQFDALVSMAYNLRPASFKRIADAVNAGEDPAPVAMQYTRPGTNLEAGLVARRQEELGIFDGSIEA